MRKFRLIEGDFEDFFGGKVDLDSKDTYMKDLGRDFSINISVSFDN